MNQKKTILILKIIVSISIITIIITSVDWEVIEENLSGISIPLILTAFLLNFIERAELTLKWKLLVKVKNIFVSFLELFNINFIGAFLGLLLPSSLGTDIIRGYYLNKYNSDKLSIVSSVIIDRLLGVLSLLLLGGVSLFFIDFSLTLFNKSIIFISVLLPFGIIYFIQKASVIQFVEKFSKKLKYKRIANFLVNLHSSIIDYKNHPYTVISSYLLSILVQITRVITYYLIALSFNIHFPIIYFLLLIPIIMLVIMLPISIGGLGVKEGAFIAFFSMVGMSVENAVLISLTNTIINLIITLLGGIPYVIFKPSYINENV